MNDDDLLDVETISLSDEEGRSLLCTIEKSMGIEGVDYLLLLPVKLPIQIFVWDEGEDEDDEVLVDIDDDEIDDIFDTARAVLSEQNLILSRTAFTLTADGDVPAPTEDDVLALNISEDDEEEDEDGEEIEQFQMLSKFFYEDQEYVICTPLEPLLFFARKTGHSDPTLLSPEEFQTVQSQLEDLLFEDID
jgi:hypothetical protein